MVAVVDRIFLFAAALAVTTSTAAQAAGIDCPDFNKPIVKSVEGGNINPKGDRIYHMPGQKYYGRTVIDESKGERWFCSEDEAIKAGWRKSLR